MKKYYVGIMLCLMFAVAGCQRVQTEDGKQYRVNPKVMNAADATVHALDLVAKPVCDLAIDACVHAGEVVGIESTEPPIKTASQENTDAWMRVIGTILTILIAL